jgi:hypothetical protein
MPSLGDPIRYVCLTSVLMALAVGLLALNHHRAKSAVLYFEELPPEVVTRLELG